MRQHALMWGARRWRRLACVLGHRRETTLASTTQVDFSERTSNGEYEGAVVRGAHLNFVVSTKFNKTCKFIAAPAFNNCSFAYATALHTQLARSDSAEDVGSGERGRTGGECGLHRCKSTRARLGRGLAPTQQSPREKGLEHQPDEVLARGQGGLMHLSCDKRGRALSSVVSHGQRPRELAARRGALRNLVAPSRGGGPVAQTSRISHS